MTKKTPPQLLTLGDVPGAVRSGKVVVVVQVREDALAMARLGAAVVAPPHGRWDDRFAPALRGASALVVPLNTPAGRDFAADVAVSLYGVATSVAVVEVPELPEGASLSEWAGGPESAARLMALRDRQSDAGRPHQMLRAIRATPTFDRDAIDALPGPIRAMAESYRSARALDVFVAGAIGVLSGCAPMLEGAYGNARYGPNLYVFVVAPAASEKGVLTHARKLAEPIDAERRSQYQAELKEWKEAQGQDSAVAGPRPRMRVLFISGDISASAIVRQLHANGGDGVLFESEADTLSQALGKEYGTFSDVLRKAHPHEPVSINRVDGEIGVGAPRLSVVLTGTPNQFPRLIPSAEDGLFSRLVVYAFVPDDPLAWLDPRPQRGADIDGALRNGAREVRRVHGRLLQRGAPLVFTLTPAQWDRLSAWGAARKRELVGPFESAGASVAHRAALHLYRLSMLIGLWEAVDRGDDVGAVASIGVSEEGFRAALSIMGVLTDHTACALGSLPRDEVQDPDEMVRWFHALPPEFTTGHAVALAATVGFKKRATNDRLAELVARGRLEKLTRGRYRKV